MSIIYSLLKFIDVNEHREKQAQHRIWMQQPGEAQDGEGPEPPSLAVQDDGRRYRCRVCGLVDASPRFCRKCLADTMTSLGR